MIDLANEAMTIKLDYDLPEYPKLEEGYRRAPRRESKLSQSDKETAIMNALRYIPKQHHEQMAKESGFWIPMMDIFDLGVPGPSGHENNTYVVEKSIFKVNNLLNSGSISSSHLNRKYVHSLLFCMQETPNIAPLSCSKNHKLIVLGAGEI